MSSRGHTTTSGMSRFHRGRDEDPRRALTLRLQAQSVQLRKRRKEERLTAKRLALSASASVATTATVVSQPLAIVQGFLEHAFNLPRFAALQGLVVNDPAGRDYLLQLVSDNEAVCRSIVAQLATSLQKPAFKRTALTILQELASLSHPFAPTDNYYGRPPLTWQDVIAQDSQLLSSLPTLTTDDETLRTAALTTLGILVQQGSRQALVFCTSHWADLLQALPQSSFCCAAILRHDETTYGMQFFPAPFATTEHLVQLFHPTGRTSNSHAHQDYTTTSSDRTVVHAAWMLQGLSFREDQVVDFLCQDDLLMDVIVQVFARAGAEIDADVLVPLLQAFGNMVTACHGQYVGMLLSRPVFVETLRSLLFGGKIVDAVPLAGCLLVDFGLPQHPSTNIAGPAMLPGLAQALLHIKYDWRAQAVQAIATALDQPAQQQQQPRPLLDMRIINDAIEKTLWSPGDMRVPILESLASLVRLDDMGATFAALAVLDNMFRCVPMSARLFESIQGPRRIDDLCNHSGEMRGSDLDEAQAIAAHLLDLYFDASDDGDESDDEMLPPPSFPDLDSDDVDFGLRAPNAYPHPAFPRPTATAHGRGRGRVMPAWMQQ